MAIVSDWVVACGTALVDRLTNRVSLIHVLDQVQVPAFPAVLPPVQIVASWHNRTEMSVSARLRIDVEDLQGETVATLSDEEITFAGRVGHRSICIVHAMTVQRPGPYRIVVRHQQLGTDDWVDGAGHAFSVGVQAVGNPSAQA